MPQSTIPAPAALQGYVDSTGLASEDLVRVWDQSAGTWVWTTLAELEVFLNSL